jgi:hypothetical protein
MNILHSYGEGREGEREGERETNKNSVNSNPKLSMNWAQFRKV